MQLIEELEDKYNQYTGKNFSFLSDRGILKTEISSLMLLYDTVYYNADDTIKFFLGSDYLNKPELLEVLKNPLREFFGFYTQICFDIRYKEAKHDLSSHPENAQYWAIKLQQYPAAFMKSAIDAINLSSELVSKWLGSCMFDSVKDEQVIYDVVNFLNEHDNSKVHNRHLSAEKCSSVGLKISMMEDDDVLQDLVLSLHHAYMITFDSSAAVKIIENHNGKRLVSSMR